MIMHTLCRLCVAIVLLAVPLAQAGPTVTSHPTAGDSSQAPPSAIAMRNGKWVNWGCFYNTYTGTNPYPSPITIDLTGGAPPCCTNGYALRVWVGGVYVADDFNNNSSYYKTGFISFIVPGNTSFTLVSYAYFYGPTSACMSAFVPQ